MSPSLIFTNTVHSYGTVDFEKRPMLNWSAIHKKISMLEDPNLGSASVLNQVENEGKRLSKWELSRVVKELRKFKRFKYALQVYEWMNNREERYRVTTSDTAIQLDLIAKVHGISIAEQYFFKLPDALKDKRIYGSLLNAYVRARMKEKAESLMDKMRTRGYAVHPLPFNVMMTLYMNLKDHEKIESLIAELKEKNIGLDIYSYNIWLSSCGSLEKMEQVFIQMEMDPNINPNWTTFSTMATVYIKLDQIEKAEVCLRKIESRITGRDRLPFHYLISLYGSAGNKEAVYRVWNVYKSSFVNIPNLGYHAVISSLVRLDEIEGAEKIYNDWLTVKTFYDPRVGNLLLGSYVRKGLSEKVESFFDQMVEAGGKPNSMSWEILAENHLKNRRIDKALYCLQNAALADGSNNWKPKPVNVCLILKISEEECDVASKDALIEILRQVGCLEDVVYMSYIPVSGGGTFTSSGPEVEDREDIDGENELLSQLQESL
ncbi:hypothetical protein RD792_004323 [Penstemon davidsonii]|uniref:Pentatricopeptide repeat-containing protein n=1 Tax=Penstemon davidsonii TaxID=160366 RepID=A0ABR0DH50_9LAMI|nr:hypothetical protein RD792_004323 [Penstemon davidsonii]